MLDSMKTKTKRRLMIAGMMSFLFVAGVAFATFENGPGSRLVSPAGLQQADGAVPIDPRTNPDDCLYEPETPKTITVAPHGSGEIGGTMSRPPASQPAASGGDSGTKPAAKPGGSRDSSSDGAPDGGTDSGGNKPSTSPHNRDQESPCPGL